MKVLFIEKEIIMVQLHFQITAEIIAGDQIGRRFTDVVNDSRINFQGWLDFFNRPEIQQRMQDSEIHHDRPALAGVVKELEATPAFRDYLGGLDSHITARGRQAIGVITYIIMEGLGWQRTGRKGSLGQRKSVRPWTNTPGGYENKSGISRWFTKAERYKPSGGYPYV